MREKRQQKQPVEIKGGKTGQEKHTQEKKKEKRKSSEVNTITVFLCQTRKKVTPAVMRSFMDDFTIVYGPI